MKSRELNSPVPGDMAKIQEQRVLSDAELIKGGGEYRINKEGTMVLVVNPESIQVKKGEMYAEIGIEANPIFPPGSNEILDEYRPQSNEQLFKELFNISYSMWFLNHNLASVREKGDDHIVFKLNNALYYAIVAILKERNKWSDEDFIRELKNTLTVSSLCKKLIIFLIFSGVG